ncbi:hypothetical protein HPT27_07990 [Permianibacter sp. IMCC34836]|uniref:hypothetical protein n=1 Tax=Permianibacter fluminis TaxID=2738515 RepID=UPI00155698D1|nr:hypothetical protein [Permianibacter fluminis]NQD36962.1 hypothetical protein [Permianibacter fluminis]
MNLKTLLITLSTTLTALLFSGVSVAHDDNWLDQQKAPHDGQLRMAGQYHIELVLTDKGMDAYLTDHAFVAQPSQGGSAAVTVLANKKVSQLKLTASGDNQLTGTGSYERSADMQVVVVLNMPGQSPLQAKFTPLRKAAASGHDHGDDHSHEKAEHSHDHTDDHQH